MRSVLEILILVPYIAWRRATRRIEWFFLFRKILQRKRLLFALRRDIQDVFEVCGGVDEISVTVYGHRGYGEESKKKKTIYWEAPIAITLWSKGTPIAGMALELRGRSLCIRQLQGVSGVRFRGALHAWPRLFVQAVIRTAKRANMQSVRLYRANQSLFYLFPSDIHTREEFVSYRKRMERRYDGTARELGFAMQKKYGVYKIQ